MFQGSKLDYVSKTLFEMGFYFFQICFVLTKHVLKLSIWFSFMWILQCNLVNTYQNNCVSNILEKKIQMEFFYTILFSIYQYSYLEILKISLMNKKYLKGFFKQW
jgi:hypothetical protein